MSETKDGRHYLRGFPIRHSSKNNRPNTKHKSQSDWQEGQPTKVGRDEMLPLTPLMNNTKWDQLRLAMYDLDDFSPRWRTKDLSGYLSDWDGEWFHHFRTSGYETIE